MDRPMISNRHGRNPWLVAAQLAMAALTVAGCSDRTEPGAFPVQYQFALAAFGGDTTAERARSYDCLLYGYFDIPQPVPANGTVQFPVTVERRLYERRGKHDEMTRADSSIAEAVLEYTGLGDISLRFVLAAGPYTVSLGPGALAGFPPQEYSGDWTCGPDVPLARDSTLLAYGYDPDLQIPGTWRVSELHSID
jgi:hypothetical protein